MPPILVSARNAARADLARAYHNYSHRLMGLGKWDEAITAGEHAIGLYRRLVRRHPDLYRMFLAGSLDNQAIALSSTNRLEEALKASQQARAVHRVLAADDSDEHLVDLARSLSNVSGIFAALDAHQAALNTSTEAVTILSQLADRKPGRYLPELASALHNQASHYAGGAWFDEAAAASGRAVAIRRRLAVQRPDGNLPGLAHSLHNFSIDLTAVVKEVAALRIIDEAISLYLRLVLDRGSSYLPHLANALNTKTAQCYGRGKAREAVIASARSVLIYMRLARERPAEFQADLAVALGTHRWARIEAGLIQHSKWDAVLAEADELIHRELPKMSRPEKDRALKEDEEIRKLATEVVSVNEVNVKNVWTEVNKVLDRYQIAPPGEQEDRGPSAFQSARPPQGVAKRIRVAPRQWLRRSHLQRRRRQWRSTVTATVTPKRVIKRIAFIFRSKENKALDRLEEPGETVEFSYMRQLEMLTRVRRGVADVATRRKSAELQLYQMRQQSAKIAGQAPRAQDADAHDSTGEVPGRTEAADKLDDQESKYGELSAEEERLTIMAQRLQQKVDAFRVQKETFMATYTAAEAKSRIDEAYGSITEVMGSIGMAMRRAQDRTTHMQARPDAIGAPNASGAFDDITGSRYEDIRAELDPSDADIDAELERLKSEIGGSPAGATDASARNANQASATDQPPTGEGS